MIAHKIGRIINGDPDYDDSWADIAGYAKLVSDRLQALSLRRAYHLLHAVTGTVQPSRCDPATLPAASTGATRSQAEWSWPSGPSLTDEQIALVEHSDALTIAVNNSYDAELLQHPPSSTGRPRLRPTCGGSSTT